MESDDLEMLNPKPGQNTEWDEKMMDLRGTKIMWSMHGRYARQVRERTENGTSTIDSHAYNTNAVDNLTAIFGLVGWVSSIEEQTK